MKNLFIILSCFFCTTLFAQNLEKYIPKEVDAIAMVRSSNLQKEFSAQQLDTLLFFKKLINSVLIRKSENFSSLKNYGVNTSSDIYWYYTASDSINYSCLLLPITNTQKFITLLNYNDIWAQATNKSVFSTQDSSVIIQLEDGVAFVVKADVNENYFKNDSVKSQIIGIKNAYDFYDRFYKIDTSSYSKNHVDESTAQSDVALDKVDTASHTTEDVVIDYNNQPNDYATKDSLWYAFQDSINLHNRLIFDSIKFGNTIEFLQQNFQRSTENSLIANVEFQRQKRSTDLVNFVYSPKLKSDYGTGISNIYTSYPNPYRTFNYMNSAMSGAWMGLNIFDKIDAHLYNQTNSLKLDVLSTLEPTIKKQYSKIFDSKLNKKFYKYIDYDHLLGSVSFAYNMEAYLDFFPKMVTKIGSAYSHGFGKDYADWTSDFISLIIDEKAIAKAYKGDGLFLIDGITPKEISYTDYVYDSSYNSTPIQKKRIDYMPSFLSMFSSDDPSLLIKALDIFVKKKKVQFDNGMYFFRVDSTFTRSYAFNIGFLIQDGIVFISSDLQKLSQIKLGKINYILNKEPKKFYANNNITMNFSSLNVLDAMNHSQVDSSYNSIKTIMSDLGNFTFNSALTKEGLESNFNYKMNKEGQNALANLLEFFNLFLHDTETHNY